MSRPIDEEAVLAACRKLWWKPPDFLRFPPPHLQKYYRISEKPGKNKQLLTRIQYSHKIPNSDMYFRIDSHDFNIKDMPRKPTYMIKKTPDGPSIANSFDQSAVYVGHRKCYLKCVKPRFLDGVMIEIFYSLIASVFYAGAEVLDFWAPDSSRVYLLMEMVHIPFRKWAGNLKGNGALYDKMNDIVTAKIRLITGYLKISHYDAFDRNFAIYEDGRLCLIDWEYADVHANHEGDAETKEIDVSERRQLQSEHTNKLLHDRMAQGRWQMLRQQVAPRVIDARSGKGKRVPVGNDGYNPDELYVNSDDEFGGDFMDAEQP